jgi:hypothetical protein
MRDSDKLKTINWVKGLALHPEHLQWMEEYVRVYARLGGIRTRGYGLLGGFHDSQGQVGVEIHSGSDLVRVVVTSCIALAPDGSVIFVKAESDNDKAYCPSCTVPLERMRGDINLYIHEHDGWPPRKEGRLSVVRQFQGPDALSVTLLSPDLVVTAVPVGEEQKSSAPPSALRIARLKFSGVRLEVDPTYIPPCLSMIGHHRLSELADRSKALIERLNDSALKVRNRFGPRWLAEATDAPDYLFAFWHLSWELAHNLAPLVETYSSTLAVGSPEQWLDFHKGLLRSAMVSISMGSVGSSDPTLAELRQANSALSDAFDTACRKAEVVLKTTTNCDDIAPNAKLAVEALEALCLLMTGAEKLGIDRPVPTKQRSKTDSSASKGPKPHKFR